MAKKTKKSRKNSKPNVFKQTTATNSTIDTNTESSIVENKSVNNKVNSSNDQVYVSGNSVSLELKKNGNNFILITFNTYNSNFYTWLNQTHSKID